MNPNPSFLPLPSLHPSSHSTNPYSDVKQYFSFHPFSPFCLISIAFVPFSSPHFSLFFPSCFPSFFLFYLISIHSTEYTFLPFLSFQSFLFLHQIPSCSFLSRFLFQHGPLSHVDIFIGHILHFIQRFPLFHP